MAKFFATCVFVINAPDEDTARDIADEVVATPDLPEDVLSAWVDEVEESEDLEEDEPGEAWGEGLDEVRPEDIDTDD